MKFADLKTGMIVILRNGGKYRVMKDTAYGDLFVSMDIKDGRSKCIEMYLYTNRGMTHAGGSKAFDVMKVMSPVRRGLDNSTAKVIWERKPTEKKAPETVKMTMEQLKQRLGFDFTITK